jgi:hypothetical protein
MIVMKGAESDIVTPAIPRLKRDALSNKADQVRMRADGFPEFLGRGRRHGVPGMRSDGETGDVTITPEITIFFIGSIV